MNSISKFSLRNGTSIILLSLLVLLAGVYSTTQIKQQTFPDVSFPAVFVQAVYPGASTEEVETEVTNPVEGSLLALKGYDSLTSTSAENASSIFIQYPFGHNMDDATRDVEGALAKLSLPEKAKVTVQRLSAGAAPIYTAAIFSTKDDPAALQKELEEEIVPKLGKIEGVSSVSLNGVKSEELRIEVDKEKAARYGITVSSVRSAIQGMDYALPLGNVSENETTIPVRLVGKLGTVDQIRNLQLTAGGGALGGAALAGAGGGGSAEGSGAQAGAGGAMAGTQTGAGGANGGASSGAGGAMGGVQAGAGRGAAGSAAAAPGEAGRGTAAAEPGGPGSGGVQSGGIGSGAAAAPAKVKLSDIATVTTVAAQNEITRFDGKESFTISVQKNQDANTAEVANKVKDTLAEYKSTANMDIRVVQDQGKEIEESVSSLVREGLFGALFCVIVIFLFLRNVRATLISIISLPLSIFVTIGILDQLGYTLNIMTLGGIAVSVGRIVDDSIVVIENIYRWRQEKGSEMKGAQLAYHATKEVISAVASSTFATVVVFLPLAFVTGIIGEFFRPFSIAVVSSILCSLLVAMTLIPVLGAKFFNKVKPHSQASRLANGFEKLLRGALRRKGLVLALAVVLLVGSFAAVPLLGVSFLPTGSVPAASIEMTLPPQSSMKMTSELSGKVEDYVSKLPGVEDYQVTIGGNAGNPFMQSGSENKATFTVQFQEGTAMEETVERMNRELKPLVTAEVPNTLVDAKESAGQQGPPSGNNVDVNLYATDMDALTKAAGQVEAAMKQNGGLKDITNNLKDVTPKWVLSLNQTGIDAGISPYQVMQAVSEQLKPLDVGTYTLDGRKWDITVAYKQTIASKKDMENIDIATAAGVKKLKDIAVITEAKAPVTINHDGGKMYAQISGTVKGKDTAAVTTDVQKDIDSLALPNGVEVKFGGGLEMITEGFQSIGIAMAAAIGLVFLVMSMTFGGLLTPTIILSSLLFVPVGAFTGLLVTGQSLSMSAMIGLLMLVGIVVTNAVVLLDRIETNRKSGVTLTEAIVEAAKTRLRPILMTAFATILALMPLAFSDASASLISKGLAVTVIGGLTTSTLLTLVVIPVLYQMTGKRRKIEEISL